MPGRPQTPGTQIVWDAKPTKHLASLGITARLEKAAPALLIKQEASVPEGRWGGHGSGWWQAQMDASGV